MAEPCPESKIMGWAERLNPNSWWNRIRSGMPFGGWIIKEYQKMYGRIIQTIGVIVVVIAIQLEVYHRANIWLILSTAGSLAFALGTKIIYFSKKQK